MTVRRSLTALVVAGLVVVATDGVAQAGSWQQFGDNPAHTGNNPAETQLIPTTVSGLTSAFTASLPRVADGSGVYQEGVVTPAGTHNMLFVHTEDGWTVGLDANTGSMIWQNQVPAGSCTINKGSSACYTTSAPVIDPSGQYVYSYGLDGKVHKYAIGTGVEVTTGGWPEVATIKPWDEKASPALTTATVAGVTYLYVGNGGYPGDNGDYQGHVTTIDLATGAQHVFNTLCSNQTVHFAWQASPDCSDVQSAVWARPAVVYDSATNLVYFATGNGTFAPGSFDWGDSVLAIHPDGTGAANGDPVDSYTPTDFQSLDNNDTDLGSTAPAIVTAPAGSTIPNLAVQSGKDGMVRLLNLSNLSGTGKPGATGGEIQVLGLPQGGEVLTQPASWVEPQNGTPWFYVANDSGLAAYVLTQTGGVPQMKLIWHNTTGGTSPIIAGNVLYYLTATGAVALNPISGVTLWAEPGGADIGLHWQSPIVADGYLYYPDGNGNLRAFTLPATATATGPIVGIASKCLDDRWAGTANGNRIQLYTCNGGVAQHWVTGPNGSLRVLGKCLDDRWAITTSGNPIQLYTCNGGAAQDWRLP